MCASKSSIRIAAAVTLSFSQKLAREGLFNDFFCFRIVLIFDIFEAKEGFLFFADAASMRISNKAIVCCVFTLGPLVNLVRLFIEAFWVEGFVAVE